ncbi:Hypothetical protein SRAE_2000144700 [Strongyloides ratti]|uniref:Uncharacterized protein n=1 Tax=Strongyloides ratti TaxID=34506 RepID=A0A090LAI1_STRRB|nr:Hypothetical protein SRAE_2000144700 [Strongyloides ratti]CEF66781.1 Hypothetical protein SRAE_2000144700 [Strongyloides ratti]
MNNQTVTIRTSEEVLKKLVEQQQGLVDDLKNVIRSINDLSNDVANGLKSILIILVIIIIAILFEEIVRVCIYARNRKRKKTLMRQQSVLDTISSITSTTSLKNLDTPETRFKWNIKKEVNSIKSKSKDSKNGEKDVIQQTGKSKDLKKDITINKGNINNSTTSTTEYKIKRKSDIDSKSISSKTENAPKEVNFFAPPKVSDSSQADTRITLSSDPSIPPHLDTKNRFQYGNKQVVDSLLISRSPNEEMYPSVTSTTSYASHKN